MTPIPRTIPLLPAPAAWLLAALLALPAAASASAAALPGFDPLVAGATAAMIPPTPGRAKEFTLLHADGLFHMFYMRDDLTVPYDSTERDFGHAVSADLEHWTQLAPVLPIRPGKWDNWHVWAPHVVEQNGLYYMYYTGVTYVPFDWTWYQRIGVAVSTDLMNWTRFDQPVYGGNVVPWAFADSSQFDGCQFRDPWVMPDPGNPGQWLMYYVTEPAAARGQLIVGAARNAGGLTPWHDVGPLWVTDAAHYWGWVESPCVFDHGGLWYLFCTTTSGHVVNFRTAPSPVADSTQWSGKYRLWDMVGQDPASDYWFGVEHLRVNDRDFLAYVNPWNSGVDIQEMLWSGAPPNFSLATPQVVSVIPAMDVVAAPSLKVLGRAARGVGVALRASLPAPSHVRIDVFDVAGRRVLTLLDGPLPRGASVVSWDARGVDGSAVERGVYFARLVAGSGRASARIVVTD